MNKKKYLILRLLISAFVGMLFLFFSFRLYYRLTDDFRIGNITYQMPSNPDWEIKPLSAEAMNQVNKILDQPFFYIGKGAQSYAFVTRDGQYVLKFFKFKHLKPNWLVQCLPNISFLGEYKKKKRERKQRLIQSVFNGYKLAYDNLQERTALVYIHLNPSSHLIKRATLFDKIGRKHCIDLSKVVFVVQKYAITTRQALTHALDTKNFPLAASRLKKIIDLYQLEYGKGIFDRDHGLMHNTGFVEERAVHFDVGKLSCDPKIKNKEWAQADLALLQKRFEEWVLRHFPRYHRRIMDCWSEKVAEILEEPFPKFCEAK